MADSKDPKDLMIQWLSHRMAILGAHMKNNEIDALMEGEDDHAHFWDKTWKTCVIYDDDGSRNLRLEWQRDGLYGEAKDEIRAALRDAMKSRRLGVEANKKGEQK